MHFGRNLSQARNQHVCQHEYQDREKNLTSCTIAMDTSTPLFSCHLVWSPQMTVKNLLPLIGGGTESIQQSCFCLMMSKAKVGAVRAANQDENRRPRHEVVNGSHNDVLGVAQDKLALQSEELCESMSVEETSSAKFLDTELVDCAVVE